MRRPSRRTGAVTDAAVVFLLRVAQEKHILKEINLERAKLAGQGTKCADAPPDGSGDFCSSCHAITVALSRLCRQWEQHSESSRFISHMFTFSGA